MFYHLTTMKILIIKKFHIRRTVKRWHGNPGFDFFLDGGSISYKLQKNQYRQESKQNKLATIETRKRETVNKDIDSEITIQHAVRQYDLSQRIRPYFPFSEFRGEYNSPLKKNKDDTC